MKNLDVLITPFAGNRGRPIGKRCVMVANPADFNLLCRLTQTTGAGSTRLMMSRLFQGGKGNGRFSLLGPFVGAPYAVILQETAIAQGAREIVLFGWCGAVSSDVHVGDIVIPSSALIDDGTSRNYINEETDEVFPSAAVQQGLKDALIKRKIIFHEGRIWSTDAVFRETHEKIQFYNKRGAIAVEMEAAAVFSVGGFRGVEVGCILVASDELFSGKWVRGFSNPAFIQSRRAVCKMFRDLILQKELVSS